MSKFKKLKQKVQELNDSLIINEPLPVDDAFYANGKYHYLTYNTY